MKNVGTLNSSLGLRRLTRLQAAPGSGPHGCCPTRSSAETVLGAGDAEPRWVKKMKPRPRALETRGNRSPYAFSVQTCQRGRGRRTQKRPERCNPLSAKGREQHHDKLKADKAHHQRERERDLHPEEETKEAEGSQRTQEPPSPRAWPQVQGEHPGLLDGDTAKDRQLASGLMIRRSHAEGQRRGAAAACLHEASTESPPALKKWERKGGEDGDEGGEK